MLFALGEGPEHGAGLLEIVDVKSGLVHPHTDVPDAGTVGAREPVCRIVPPIPPDSILVTLPGSRREEARDVSECERAGFGKE